MAERFPVVKENIHFSDSMFVFTVLTVTVLVFTRSCAPVGTGVGRDQIVGQGL